METNDNDRQEGGNFDMYYTLTILCIYGTTADWCDFIKYQNYILKFIVHLILFLDAFNR